MLESVTLAQVVEVVIQMLVDLSGLAVFREETTENSETAHPQNFAEQMWEKGISASHDWIIREER